MVTTFSFAPVCQMQVLKLESQFACHLCKCVHRARHCIFIYRKNSVNGREEAICVITVEVDGEHNGLYSSNQTLEITIYSSYCSLSLFCKKKKKRFCRMMLCPSALGPGKNNVLGSHNRDDITWLLSCSMMWGISVIKPFCFSILRHLLPPMDMTQSIDNRKWRQWHASEILGWT